MLCCGCGPAVFCLSKSSQSVMMSFLFRRKSSHKDRSPFLASPSKPSKNKLPQSSIHFLKKVRSIQGVVEAYASDRKTTFVKLENQRIICLKGHNTNSLYGYLREMYIAQDNEEYLNYLQGSRSSGASSTDRAKYSNSDLGISCSDNIKDYVIKRQYRGRRTPTPTSPPNSLISGSQSSLEGPNLRRTSSKASTSRLVSESKMRRKSSIENQVLQNIQKLPLLQKALANVKWSDAESENKYNAALLRIDECMRNTFNLDFINLFANSPALLSLKGYDGYDEDEDDGSLDMSHQALRQYENLPYKHFPPLTTHSDDSGDDHKNADSKVTELQEKGMSVESDLTSQLRAKERYPLRRSSAPAEKTRSSSHRNKKASPMTSSTSEKNKVGDPGKNSNQQRFIKVYRPGHARPIFISGATTLGGLPEPARSTEKRLSERLKHRPSTAISSGYTSRGTQSESIVGSCPVMVEVGEVEERLASGYGQTVSLSETYLAGRKLHAERAPPSAQTEHGENYASQLTPPSFCDVPSSHHDMSFQLESSLQDANDLVRTLFDNLSVGAPVLSSASGKVDQPGGATSCVDQSEATESTQSADAVDAPGNITTVTRSATTESLYKSRDGSSGTDSFPSVSYNSDTRKTV